MLSSIFVLFVLFQNIISNVFPVIPGYYYWDEFSVILLIVFYLVSRNSTVMKLSVFKLVASILGVILIGLLGNLYFGYAHSIGSILRDLVGFIKFPVTLIILMESKKSKILLSKGVFKAIPYIKAFIVVIFVFGLISLFMDLGMSQEEIRGGIHPYQFLYSHPTYLVTSMVCSIAILNVYEESNNLNYDLMVTTVIILSMRTKGIAIIGVYIFIKYLAKKLYKFRFLYWLIIFLIILYFSIDKLLLYASFSNSPRESLYRGAFTLLFTTFPVGSGFATFASHVSGEYYSSVYDFIEIAGMYLIDGSISPVIGDSGFPYYIGQFGFLGVLLLLYATYQVYKIYIYPIGSSKRLAPNLVILLIFISLTSEAILVNNGFELAVVLAITIFASRTVSSNDVININTMKPIISEE